MLMEQVLLTIDDLTKVEMAFRSILDKSEQKPMDGGGHVGTGVGGSGDGHVSGSGDNDGSSKLCFSKESVTPIQPRRRPRPPPPKDDELTPELEKLFKEYFEKDHSSTNNNSNVINNGGKSDTRSPRSRKEVHFVNYLLTYKERLTIFTKLDYEIEDLDRPIGVTVLGNRNIAVAISGRDIVRIFDPNGSPVGLLQSGRGFRRPTDMATLEDGRFAVRDDIGIQLFDHSGYFIKAVGEGLTGRVFGLAAIRNQLVVVNVGRRSSGSLTKPGETDVLLISVDTNEVTERIPLASVISDPEGSRCRFVGTDGNIIYVGDLGLDKIYAYHLSRRGFKTFSGSTLNRRSTEPAGMIADTDGTLILVDARNNQLQIFDARRNYLGIVSTPKPLCRPSGIAIDRETGSLYVLNLKGNSLYKLTMTKRN